jgi:hypothetical protein
MSKRYGKCSKLGRTSNLRFAYEDGIVFCMTPKFGLCDDWLDPEEAKIHIENEK